VRRVVFGAFSDPNELAKWWGPRGFSTPSLELQARVGLRYRIEMQPPQGDRFYLTAKFREVDPPARLACTFVWEDPDPDDVDTVVDLSFRDLGESTEVSLRQRPFKTEARRRLYPGRQDGQLRQARAPHVRPSQSRPGFASRETGPRRSRGARNGAPASPAPSSHQAPAKAMEALGLNPPTDRLGQPPGGQHGTRL
jgi:uncharacterized protein YndB with AHSA1/START domain